MARTIKTSGRTAASRRIPALPPVALYVLLTACAVALLAELAIRVTPHFDFDGFFGFHAALGLVSAVALILVAVLCEPLLKRQESGHDH